MARFVIKTDTNWGTFRTVVEAADEVQAFDAAARRIERDVTERAAAKGLDAPAVIIRHHGVLQAA